MKRIGFSWPMNSRGSNRLLWAGLLLVLLGGLLFAGCSRPTAAPPQQEPGQGRQEMPMAQNPPDNGQMPMGNHDGNAMSGMVPTGKPLSEKELGISFYPGAAVGKSESMGGDTGGKGGEMKQVTLATPDPVEKVKAFYLKQYPKAKIMTMNNPETEYTQLIAQDGKEQRYINITREAKADKTQIVLHYMTQ